MKLTKLVLENFRSVRERQEIDFAPVTLLLGPNSAGKTTILIALFYLQQILDCKMASESIAVWHSNRS
ncbi:AAA family ATPase [Escherichia coli]|uniref:AAA family ATPase n=1 Tax=Escherichia coli TaxID=562 RepID=UPI001FCF038E|nr:AAA family ATPase [Escherichia coli]